MKLKIVGLKFKRNIILASWLGIMFLIVCASGAQTFNVLTSFGSLTNNTGRSLLSKLLQGPDGTLYGTTTAGAGSTAGGSVFKLNSDGTSFTVLHSFSGSGEGTEPGYPGGLVMVSNTLYGTTFEGGSNGYGTVFAMNTDGSGYTDLYDFGPPPDAGNPSAELIVSSNRLYGTTYNGGSVGIGAAFAINTDGSDYAVLHSFAGVPTDGSTPLAAFLLSSNILYGTTVYGGSAGQGAVFAMNTDGSGYRILYSFQYNFINNPDGAAPYGELVLASNRLYGTTLNGGLDHNGTIFAINTDGSGYTSFYSFTNSPDGNYPEAGLVLSSNTLYGTTVQGGTNGFGTIYAINTDGSGYTNFYSFTNSPDGNSPATELILSSNRLYGTTLYGGNGGNGTVFAINTDRSDYTVLFNNFFNGYSGANPQSGLVLSGSTLYGTTGDGGPAGQGTVFAINTNGTGYTVLYNFGSSPTDASSPYSLLTLSGDTLYGTTIYGGTSGQGTIFAINTDGTGYTNLYSFNGYPTDGSFPYAGLTLSGNTLYGVAEYGGTNNYGTVFAINTDGTGYTNLYNFGSGSADGQEPYGVLVLSGNTLYGTTTSGGANYCGTVFAINTDGSDYTNLHSFINYPTDGSSPYGALTLSGNTLYGTTQGGGTSAYGTVFAINTDGTGETVLYSFTGGADGSLPFAGVTLSGNTLYGTTGYGGINGQGTLFAIKTNGTGFTVLHDLNAVSDGQYANGTPVVFGNTLYGTTEAGGILNVGTVFSLDATPSIMANNNTYTRNGLNTWRIKVSDLLTNVTDLNSNTLSLANVGISTNGVSLRLSYGYVQYYNTNLVDDQFTYQVTDNSGALSTGVITLTVNNPTGGQINSLTVTGGTVNLTFAGIPSYLYHVQVSTNLTDWVTLETTNAPGNGIFQFLDGNPPQPSAFYRLMWNGN